MRPSVFQPGHTAVITGGASGIGRALAAKCLAHGMKVLIADCDDETLGAVVADNNNNNLGTISVDVSKLDDWARLKSRVDRDFDGRINLLALNAGIAPPFPSSWTSSSSTTTAFRTTLDVNLLGVINGITTCLSSVAPAPAGAIVITGSKQGITNPPGNAAYNASKAAVRAVAEQLAFDLRAAGCPAVHLLVPGWTFTGLCGNRPGGKVDKPAGAWWPEQVVDFLEKKMDDGQFWVLCPDDQVTEDLDRKRMLWGALDAIEGRPPLTRWRDEWKDKHQDWLEKQT